MAMLLDIQNLALVNPGDKLGHAVVAVTAALVARGWVVRGSGDGLAALQNLEQTAGPYNVFTSGVGYVAVSSTWGSPTVPNTITNPRAWIRLKEPGASTREIIFQRCSTGALTNENHLICRIAKGGYTGSGATALSPPTAPGGDASVIGGAFNSAGLVILPNGSSAPGFSIMANSRIKYLNMLISDSARAGNVWPFYFWGVDATDTSRDFALVYESLLDLTDVDVEPWVALGGVWSSVFGVQTSVVAGPALVGYVGGVLTAQSWGYYVFSAGNWPGAQPPDPNFPPGGDGKLRSPYTWVTSTQGTYGTGGVLRGRMEHILMNPLEQTFPDVVDPTTANAKLCSGRLLLPWPVNTAPAY